MKFVTKASCSPTIAAVVKAEISPHPFFCFSLATSPISHWVGSIIQIQAVCHHKRKKLPFLLYPSLSFSYFYLLPNVLTKHKM